jgi:signal transduction histidine kinase
MLIRHKLYIIIVLSFVFSYSLFFLVYYSRQTEKTLNSHISRANKTELKLNNLRLSTNENINLKEKANLNDLKIIINDWTNITILIKEIKNLHPKAIKVDIDEINKTFLEIEKSIKNNDTSKRKELSSHLAVILDKITTQIHLILDIDLHEMHSLQKETSTLMLFLNICFVIFFVIFSYLIIKTIIKPLSILENSAKDIGKGNLDLRIDIKTDDEFGTLGSSFNQMQENLKHMTASRDDLNKEIEERKKAENLLIQTEKLTALGEMTAGLTHELNSPLSGLINLIRLQKEEVQNSPEKLAETQEIEKALIHMQRVVNDFTSFARPVKEEHELCDINQIIEDSLALAEINLKKKNIKIEKHFDSSLPQIIINSAKIKQVMLNLINNAIDSIEGEGTISISSKKENSNYLIEVADTGCGIDPKIYKHLYDPFFTTKKLRRGTGLGLSIVHTIIKNHGGSINVKSELGKGTTFYIRIPKEIINNMDNQNG